MDSFERFILRKYIKIKSIDPYKEVFSLSQEDGDEVDLEGKKRGLTPEEINVKVTLACGYASSLSQREKLRYGTLPLSDPVIEGAKEDDDAKAVAAKKAKEVADAKATAAKKAKEDDDAKAVAAKKAKEIADAKATAAKKAKEDDNAKAAAAKKAKEDAVKEWLKRIFLFIVSILIMISLIKQCGSDESKPPIEDSSGAETAIDSVGVGQTDGVEDTEDSGIGISEPVGAKKEAVPQTPIHKVPTPKAKVNTPSMKTWYYDSDGDGFGDPTRALKSTTNPGGNYKDKAGDCDDSDFEISPVIIEKCDGKDNNCNGIIDEGCKTTNSSYNTKTNIPSTTNSTAQQVTAPKDCSISNVSIDIISENIPPSTVFYFDESTNQITTSFSSTIKASSWTLPTGETVKVRPSFSSRKIGRYTVELNYNDNCGKSRKESKHFNYKVDKKYFNSLINDIVARGNSKGEDPSLQSKADKAEQQLSQYVDNVNIPVFQRVTKNGLETDIVTGITENYNLFTMHLYLPKINDDAKINNVKIETIEYDNISGKISKLVYTQQ